MTFTTLLSKGQGGAAPSALEVNAGVATATAQALDATADNGLVNGGLIPLLLASATTATTGTSVNAGIATALAIALAANAAIAVNAGAASATARPMPA